MKKVILLSLVFMLLGSLFEPFNISAEVTGFDYDNYYELEYIKAENNCYMLTGLTGNNYEVYVDFKKDSNTAENSLFGLSNDTGTGFRMEMYSDNSNNFGFWEGVSNSFSTVTLGNNVRTQLTYTQTSSNLTMFIGGITKTKNVTTADTSKFYINSYNGGIRKFGRYTYYKFRIKQNNVLVRDYIPAMRKSDNKVGFYDLVNNEFISSAVAGQQFTAGAIVVYDKYNVSVAASPVEGGSVSGGGQFNSGDTALLTAIPNEGYVFSGWSNGQTSNPLSVLVTDDISLTAYFTLDQSINRYNVVTSVNPANSGSVSGGGTFDENTQITLTATPNSGYVFSNWSNGSTSNPLTFILNDNVNITANFTQQSQVTTYTINTFSDPNNGGSVTGGGTYQDGTTINLQAIANTGFMFSGWYIGNDLVYNSNPLSLLVDNNYNLIAKFTAIPVSDTFTPWTDTDDRVELIDISNEYSRDDFIFTISSRKVLDGFITDTNQITFNSSNFGNIRIAGTYYDNSIVGLTACNSTQINQSNSDTSPTENITIRPVVSGRLNAGDIGYLDFGIEVVDQNIGSTSSTSTSISNTTQACKLVGMNNGDGAVDQETLRQLGYTAKTISYNDGSTYGHTATVFVPGNEEMSMQINGSDIKSMLNALIVNINQNFYQVYHYEYDVSISTKPGVVMPEYGHFRMNVPLSIFLNDIGIVSNNLNTYLVDNLNTKYTLLEGSDPIKSNNGFNYHITDNKYDRNYIDLYWNGKINPQWHFSTNSISSYLQGDWITDVNMYNTQYVYNYKSLLDIAEEIYTITADDVLVNSQLAQGVKLQVGGINSFEVYRYKDNSLLNRFNQLGSFLNGWFSRIYNSVSNITGGSESNDITNNIVNNNNIEVNNNIQQTINNLQDQDNEINLQLPEFTISNDHLTGIGKLGQLTSETFKSYTDNDLGIFILLPIIIIILGLIL